MTDAYRDAWISCADDAIRIRGYYFPWGAKTIPYEAIRSVERIEQGAATGQFRLWGTAKPTVWASLDPHRMRKREGLLLDVGRRIRPYITPDDPAAVIAVLNRHAVPGAAPEGTPHR
ncbi:hypothetical protein [Streptomyces sp. NBC_01198]|uniref:hypothetical protein n=1 Tax=Streptomyces sp. NBC_01198 TaxID=2903769 RepID=UPI002E10D8DD|nr:PH domain-containing protein [Streptomyces sp. NBC_01198]